MKVTNKIPVPDNVGRGKPRTRFPFSLLEKIGDSFFVEGVGAKDSVYTSLRSYNKSIAKKPIRITIRAEHNGIRVWRIRGNNKKK